MKVQPISVLINPKPVKLIRNPRKYFKSCKMEID